MFPMLMFKRVKRETAALKEELQHQVIVILNLAVMYYVEFSCVY